jgi:N-acetylglucosaminyldiphosphoundecaprenol N-acetyl-beta-D-mannosaminyltransferase
MMKAKDQTDEMNGEFQSVQILGSSIHLVDIAGVISQMGRWIREHDRDGKCRQVVVTGFHGIWEAHKHHDFKAIVNSADLWIPDGISFAIIARKKGFRSFKKLASSDFIKAFFEVGDREGYSSFFYGDTDETLIALKEKLSARYPGHRVVGTFSPPFRLLTPDEDEEIVNMINEARPDVLWVGLGCPKQDRWIYEHKDRLMVPMAVGVGAAFSFFAETVKRSPQWVEKNGFEWLWRFIQEPKKLWKRDLIEGPRFLFHVALELTGLRKYE